MAWSLGSVVNNYSQPIAIQAVQASGATVDYSAAPISGGNINVVVPLSGTLVLVDLGRVPGREPPFGIDAFFLDQTWSFSYATTTKINVVVAGDGSVTLTQVQP
ncbi:MAG TPA: hypothetical protein VF605_16730 [Allosphingosinicella sp.]|jgi:hypothetical protein